MPHIANISPNPILFREKPKADGGEGDVVEIAPGDAKSVDIDRDHDRVTAYENAKLIVVGGTEAQAKKAARERSPALTDGAVTGTD